MALKTLLIPVSTLVLFSLLMTNCYGPIDTTRYYYDDEQGQDGTVGNFFCFENEKNWWEYSDENGNRFSIKVIDTISDNNSLYYKVAFEEHKLKVSQDDWFVREKGQIRFNENLRGTFSLFLPAEFHYQSGEFISSGNTIDYSIYQSITIHDTTVKKVALLEYEQAILHGFDKIYFANNIGIVKMIDDDGRWPIRYSLDSCRIEGEIYRF